MRIIALLFILLSFIVQSAPLAAAPDIKLMLASSLMPSSEELKAELASFTVCGEKLDNKLNELRSYAYVSGAPKEKKIDLASFMLWKVKLQLEKNSAYADNEALILEASDLLPGSFYVEDLWGDLLNLKKNYADALMHYEYALGEKPDNLDTLFKAGVSALLMLQYERARGYFQTILSFNVRSFAVFYYLGVCSTYLQEPEEAADYLESAIECAQNDKERKMAQDALRGVREHLASTEGSTSDENQHFVLNFAGDSQADLGDMTSEALENIYYQVTESLNFDPDERVNVTFFRTEDYYKQGKNWSAASAKGINVMVPLSSGYQNEDTLKSLLAHEFTHTIINMKTGNRCPLWLHEGIAQYQEYETAYGSPDVIRPDFEGVMQNEFIDEQKNTSIANVQGLIGSSSRKDVTRGYVTSYMAVRCLNEQYGSDSIDTLLTSLGQGKTMDEAMTDATGGDMESFQEEFDGWLRNQ